MFLFREIIKDLKSRIPLYISDWRDGLKFKIISATLFMFFSQLLPAATFGAYMDSKTEKSIGVVEAILSTGASSVLWSLFTGQPIVIVGVTGPISIYTATVFQLCKIWSIPFLAFMSWIGVWTGLMIILLACLNACSLVKYCTRFSGEIFGMLVSILFLESAIREFITVWSHSTRESALVSAILVIATYYLCSTFHHARSWNILWTGALRGIIADYGAVFSLLICSLCQLLPLWSDVPITRLPVPASFATTNGRSWLVTDQMRDLPVGLCFAAIIPSLVLTALVFFDHNVSSLLAQQEQFGLKKPASYNWDFVVLGFLTILCSIFGLPYPNGLIPQAPLHTRALATIKHVRLSSNHTKEVYESVAETRLANFLHGALMCVSAVFVWIFGLIPSAVLIGFFLYLGYSGLLDFQFSGRLKLMITQQTKRTPARYLRAPFKDIFIFTLVQLVCTGVIFGVTLTPAAVSFPIFIVALVPLRLFGLIRLLSANSLDFLDGPDADAPVIATSAPIGEGAPQSNEDPTERLGDDDGSESVLVDPDVET